VRLSLVGYGGGGSAIGSSSISGGGGRGSVEIAMKEEGRVSKR